jgi:hypothetical protein
MVSAAMRVHNLAGKPTMVRMRLGWLHSRFGINFVAVGIVATIVAAGVIGVQDIWFLVTGLWLRLPWYREVLYCLLAAVAAIFTAVNVFVFRPGLPRFVAVVVAICFASYVVQPFAQVSLPHLTAICSGRILGFCTLLLLVRTYFVDLKAGRVAR